MAKHTKRQRLPRQQRNELLASFAQALVTIQSPEDGVKFIQDLLSEQEAEMLAKRLAIADRLIDGARYADIYKELRVSPPTIARVNAWLQTSGDGFRIVRNRPEAPSLRTVPRRRQRLTMYNWPAVLLEEILAQASHKRRKRLEAILNRLDEKSELYRDLQPFFELPPEPSPQSPKRTSSTSSPDSKTPS